MMLQNVKQKKLLALVLGATFGVAAQGAHAAVTFTNNKAFATEIAADEVTLVKGGRASAPITSFGPSEAQQLFVTVSMDNGAKFNATPKVLCDAVTAAAAAVREVSATWNLGGAGASTASFSMGSAALAAQYTGANISGSCHVTGLTITNVTGNVSPITMTVNYQYGSLSTSVETGTAVTFAQGVSAGLIAGSNVAEVTSSFQSFTAASSATNIAWLGNVKLSLTTTGILAAGAAIAVADVVTGASITLTGPALAAAKSASGIYLTTGTCVAGAVLHSIATATSPVTFTGVDVVNLAAGVEVCMTVTGASIPEDTITASITGNAKVGTVANSRRPNLTLASSTLSTITRNGSSATIMNLPRGDEAAAGGDAGFLRIYNTSSLAGPVTATVYSQGTTAGSSSGAVVATGCSLTSSLGGNQALVLSSSALDALLTACGATLPTTGRYRIELAGAFPTMKAQAFSRSNNTLTNISAKLR